MEAKIYVLTKIDGDYAYLKDEGGEELLSELKLVMPKYHKDGKIYGEIV